MKFLITGDLVINKKYDALRNIDQKVIDLFSTSDINIVNLEAPVTDSESKIIKTGPHLKSNKIYTLDVLKKLNIGIVALANNHIKDYGEKGVLDTIAFCEDNSIKAIGAGINLKEASKTTILNTSEGKIALINIAENEWSSAEENSAGANGMSFIKDTKKIQQAKRDNDFVFVIVHGGHEYYNLPSPRMQEQYRFYAEQGADLVVGHHTHCISGYEIYDGTPIYYSLGNFLFTMTSTYQDWYTGAILEVKIINGRLVTILHPIHQTKDGFNLSLLEGEDKANFLVRVESYSKILSIKEKLSEEWENFTTSKEKGYLSYWSPLSFIKSRYLAWFLRKLNLRLINKPGLALYLNLMRCEAHHDLSKEVIKDHLGK